MGADGGNQAKQRQALTSSQNFTRLATSSKHPTRPRRDFLEESGYQNVGDGPLGEARADETSKSSQQHGRNDSSARFWSVSLVMTRGWPPTRPFNMTLPFPKDWSSTQISSRLGGRAFFLTAPVDEAASGLERSGGCLCGLTSARKRAKIWFAHRRSTGYGATAPSRSLELPEEHVDVSERQAMADTAAWVVMGDGRYGASRSTTWSVKRLSKPGWQRANRTAAPAISVTRRARAGDDRGELVARSVSGNGAISAGNRVFPQKFGRERGGGGRTATVVHKAGQSAWGTHCRGG